MQEKKYALITGAAGGIGAAIARAAQQKGYHTILMDVEESALRSTAASIAHAQACVCDITDADAVAAVIAGLDKAPELLVNNAGVVKFAPFLEISPEAFKQIIDVNINGAFVVAQLVARRMQAEGVAGNIVNISSIGGMTPSLGTNAYAVSKAGLAKMTELMALELGPLGIRVNTVSPGFIDGGMSASIYANPQARQIRTNAVPLKRLGQEQDIANAVMFLASQEAAFITGHNLVVDGGVVPSALYQVPRS